MREIQKTATTKQISEIYGIPVGTLANLRYQKRGPKYYRVSRKVLYAISDVEDWIMRNPVLTSESLPESE
ncbi:MAG TPA: helix-turn-helix domain-containing protein [Desulfobacterales bacterium]|nr:helix-turn-helix domain-containing protein [Desulfobacterales bacterium]